MMRVDQAIRRVNRDVLLVWAIHGLLAGAVIVSLVAGTIVGVPPVLLAAIPCIVWVLLAVNGYRETHNAMRWPMLIASGELAEAEKEIERAIDGFSVLRSVKLMSLHQLAVLRMAQRNWTDAARLSKAIQRYRLGRDGGLTRASLLVLANAASRVGAMRDAYDALQQLRGMRLALDEQLSLLHAESAYLARIGAWETLVQQVQVKSHLAELMPSEPAAQTQAYLAMAARRLGDESCAAYLVRRCQLLCNPAKLVAEEPMFGELWPRDP